MADHRSPRVNKALMANYQGQTVRLIAKLTTVRTWQSLKRLIGTSSHSAMQFKDDVAIVEASDGGEVEVKLLRVRTDGPYIYSRDSAPHHPHSVWSQCHLQTFSPSSTYLEVIGQVTNERTIKMVGYVGMGDDVGKLPNRPIPLPGQYLLDWGTCRHETCRSGRTDMARQTVCFGVLIDCSSVDVSFGTLTSL